MKPNEYPAFTRFNLFLRDRFRCVYCGSGKELTFDHVVPRAHGGRTMWENVATACAPCNLRKGDRLPHEIGMRLRSKPRPPSPTLFLTLQATEVPHAWLDYLPRQRVL